MTNRGLATMFTTCPRLTNLTLRQSPYVTAFPTLAGADSAPKDSEEATSSVIVPPGPPAVEAEGTGISQGGVSGAAVPEPVAAYLPLRTLTLENCPNISVEVCSHQSS